VGTGGCNLQLTLAIRMITTFQHTSCEQNELTAVGDVPMGDEVGRY
jgi:hypothetical protein